MQTLWFELSAFYTNVEILVLNPLLLLMDLFRAGHVCVPAGCQGMPGSDRQAISEQVALSLPGVIFNALKSYTALYGVLPAYETTAGGSSSAGCLGAPLDQMLRACGLGHESLLSFPFLTTAAKGTKVELTVWQPQEACDMHFN